MASPRSRATAKTNAAKTTAAKPAVAASTDAKPAASAPAAAIPGDWVICVGSSAAREAAGSKSYPSDLTIVGIIDHWDPDAAKEMAAGKPANPGAPSGSGGAK